MDEYITIALPKGKLFDKAVNMLAKVGYSAENVVEDSRKLVISNEETKVRFIIAKTVDVPTYVEYGAADIGIIGKDVLNEQGKDVVELLDLDFGRCRLMMAVPEATKRANLTDYAHTRAATKYPNCAKRYFDKLGIQVELIKLNGSIELGPIVGLSESIVDIVETGTTLRENKLVEIDSLFTATARLIANRASFKLKFARLHKLVEDLRVVVAENAAAKAAKK
ncbi:MAG: ATP phosphoribosyltransferase [Phascolarctobacterium sp.]|nr:ATP phosphoribosyltransferase [Phascolarctobacterium sp.]